MRLFGSVFLFEIKTWLRGMMVYVFLAIVTLFAFLATSSENVSIGGGQNTHLNAPYLIQLIYAIMAVLGCAMVTAFVNSATTRDFSSNMHPLIFAQPIRKLPLLMGRFWGATLVSCIPMVGVSLGILITGIFPGNEPEELGPVCWAAHGWSWAVFVIPNTILIAAIIYAIATWTRSTAASFIGLLVLLIGDTLSDRLTSNLEQEWIGVLLDPFGFAAFESVTKYWTTVEKNSQFVTLTGMVLANRLLWLSVSGLIVALATWRFSFSLRSQKGSAAQESERIPLVSLPQVAPKWGWRLTWTQLISKFSTDLTGMLRSPIFLVVMLFAMFMLITTLFLVADEAYGLQSYPVTYAVVDLIRGSLYVFLLALITFLAGALVWKEREAKLNEVLDALPFPTWTTSVAKIAALIVLVVSILLVGISAGVLVQAFKGYTRFQLDVYFVELLGWDLVSFFCLMVLAVFLHVISPNKYVGYFAFVVLMIVNAFVWNWLEIESNLVRYGSLPGYIYSDLFRWTPYASGLIWFSVYWLSVACLLTLAATLFWQRGTEHHWGYRFWAAWSRWAGSLRVASAILLAVWLGSGAWIAYNTLFLNSWKTDEQTSLLRVEYEKQFKKHEAQVQPRVIDVSYTIDLYPERQGMVLRGTETLKNCSPQSIERLYYNTTDDFETTLDIPDAVLEEEHPDMNYYVYRLLTPLEPEGMMQIRYEVKRETVGFKNEASTAGIVNNGTFFDNQVVPQLGYQSEYELDDKKERRDRNLEPKPAMPELRPDDLGLRSNHYISSNSDWVTVESVISTSKDQIAVGPGSLVKTWEEADRRYFHYKLDHPSLNFYSFVSARYEVESREWNGIDIEVYFHPEHRWNVDNMLRSIRDSLQYYTEQFGPYRHRQARIIEFPRVATFAQAFPGTMPYSEGIGFIANLKSKDDIDMVYYVVAHEMAHQWWAHQVIGANMQGATLLSETLAQYSALMVMEREFGRDQMMRFLKFEMDGYLKGRGVQSRKELPLLKVTADQSYVHYQKGSVVMYYLKEMVGEQAINAALRKLLERFAYAQPPYPTAIDLVDALREQIPSEMHYLLTDLFERITLHDNRCLKASYREMEDGKFEVQLQFSVRKLEVAEDETETEVAMDDFVEIGAFGKPESGRKHGKLLHRERKRLTAGEHQWKFIVDELPYSVGVDPFYLLVDRQPDDNMKRPTLVD